MITSVKRGEKMPLDIQFTKTDGSKIDPTGSPQVLVYDEDNTLEPSASGLALSKVGGKTGFYGAIWTVSLTATLGIHTALFEATVDGTDTAIPYQFKVTLIDEGDLLTEIDYIPTAGEGSVAVDHDYGGAGNYIISTGGVPIDNADIFIFLKSDWDAGNRSKTTHLKAHSRSDVIG